MRGALGRAGFDVVPRIPGPRIPLDCDERTAQVIREVTPYTLTPPERIMALREALRYVEAARIPGAIVECGVWRGGSMMAAALTLLELGTSERELHLFDTFAEMPPPDERDRHVTGFAWPDVFADPAGLENPTYRYLPLERVRALLLETGYPPERLRFVAGLVEETIPAGAPEEIALLRLDTDWYRSTAHEMEHLYDRISPGGVLIVDDYGEFLGARRAVDEHLEADGRPVLLNRVDMSCRVIIVPPR